MKNNKKKTMDDNILFVGKSFDSQYIKINI